MQTWSPFQVISMNMNTLPQIHASAYANQSGKQSNYRQQDDIEHKLPAVRQLAKNVFRHFCFYC